MSALTADRESMAFPRMPPIEPPYGFAELTAEPWRPSPLAYLAGPIAGLTHDGATDWRERAAELLAPEVVALSPMRGKAYLKHAGVIGNAPYLQPLSSDRGIVARDRFDVRRADLVIANLAGARAVSIGSCVEFGWADAFGTPVLLVLNAGELHDHPFLRQLAGWTVQTVEDACELAKVILLP